MYPYAPAPGTFNGTRPTPQQPDALLGDDDRTGESFLLAGMGALLGVVFRRLRNARAAERHRLGTHAHRAPHQSRCARGAVYHRSDAPHRHVFGLAPALRALSTAPAATSLRYRPGRGNARAADLGKKPGGGASGAFPGSRQRRRAVHQSSGTSCAAPTAACGAITCC